MQQQNLIRASWLDEVGSGSSARVNKGPTLLFLSDQNILKGFYSTSRSSIIRTERDGAFNTAKMALYVDLEQSIKTLYDPQGNPSQESH